MSTEARSSAFLVALPASTSALDRPDGDEGGIAEPRPRPLHLDRLANRPGQSLTPRSLTETGLGEQAVDLLGGEEHSIAVEHALVPVSLVMPAEAARPIDEPDQDSAARLEDPASLREHRPRIVHETDRGDDQRKVERAVAEGQRLGDRTGDLDPAPAGLLQHPERRIDADPDAQGLGEAAGPDADL